MKKKRTNTKYIFLTLILILLFFICGLAANNVLKVKKYTKKEITVIKKAEHTDVDNPRIFEMDDILYSENGDIYEGFKDAPGYPHYCYKYDRTGMAVTADNKVYYIDGKLEPRYLSESSTSAVISKKADFVLYNDEAHEGCVYDAANDQKITICKDYFTVYDSAISSNGRYVAFYEKESGTIIRDVQNPESFTTVSKKDLDAIAVSPDGKRAFFKNYDDETYFAYSYHDGELFEIARGNHFDFFVNDECTEAFVSDIYSTYFYSTDMETGVKILDDDLFEVSCQKGPYGIVGKHSSNMIADVESFKGCILETISKDYYFDSPYKSLILLDQYSSNELLGFDNGTVYRLYRDSDSDLCIETMENGHLKSNKIEGIDPFVRSYTACDNLSKIYYVDRDGNLWLYENGEHKLLHSSPDLHSNIQYDSFSQRLFFIEKESLYSIGDDPEDCRLEFENADYISHNYYDYEDFVVFSYKMGNRYVRVFGNYMLFDS